MKKIIVNGVTFGESDMSACMVATQGKRRVYKIPIQSYRIGIREVFQFLFDGGWGIVVGTNIKDIESQQS